METSSIGQCQINRKVSVPEKESGCILNFDDATKDKCECGSGKGNQVMVWHLA